MDLADRLLLLAVAADNDGWPMDASGRPAVSSAYQRVTAAALVAELALRRRITPGRRLTLVDPTPTGDAELDIALGVVPPAGRSVGRSVGRCVSAVAARRPDLARLHRMRGQGLVHTYSHGGRQRLFVRETTVALEQVTEVLHVAMRGGHCDEPTRALLALLRECGLHRFWLGGLPRKERDRRLRDLITDDWLVGTAGFDPPAIM